MAGLTAVTASGGSAIDGPKSEAKVTVTKLPPGSVEKEPDESISVDERKMPISWPGWMKGAFTAPMRAG